MELPFTDVLVNISTKNVGTKNINIPLIMHGGVEY